MTIPLNPYTGGPSCERGTRVGGCVAAAPESALQIDKHDCSSETQHYYYHKRQRDLSVDVWLCGHEWLNA
jgi:hypothetical protein